MPEEEENNSEEETQSEEEKQENNSESMHEESSSKEKLIEKKLDAIRSIIDMDKEDSKENIEITDSEENQEESGEEEKKEEEEPKDSKKEIKMLIAIVAVVIGIFLILFIALKSDDDSLVTGEAVKYMDKEDKTAKAKKEPKDIDYEKEAKDNLLNMFGSPEKDEQDVEEEKEDHNDEEDKKEDFYEKETKLVSPFLVKIEKSLKDIGKNLLDDLLNPRQNGTEE
ncbi:hypothetical protein GF336_07470 [Candidatus Woesearchaeota archaeon]|nr:hypothetical protein [Candidatus Woesearchaeota archaeon]